MPTFHYEPRTINDKSTLSPGLHPAFLLAIRDEETPEGWQMAEKSPRMWRWVFAVWDTPQAIAHGATPERQSATSTQTFSPGGKFQPSKAYLWTCKLLGRKVESGESVDLDPLLPLPCLVQVTRTKADMTPIEYANIPSIDPWPDGATLLTPDLRSRLSQLLETPAAREPVQSAPTMAAVPLPAPAWPQSQPQAPQPASVPTVRW